MIRPLSVLAKAGLANDRHSRVIGNLLKGLREVPQSVLAYSTLWGKTSNGPFPDFDAVEKLLPTHVPDSLIRQSLHLGPATILKFGRRQDTASDLHEAVADVEAEFLDVGVVVKVGLSYKVVDLSFTVWC